MAEARTCRRLASLLHKAKGVLRAPGVTRQKTLLCTQSCPGMHARKDRDSSSRSPASPLHQSRLHHSWWNGATAPSAAHFPSQCSANHPTASARAGMAVLQPGRPLVRPCGRQPLPQIRAQRAQRGSLAAARQELKAAAQELVSADSRCWGVAARQGGSGGAFSRSKSLRAVGVGVCCLPCLHSPSTRCACQCAVHLPLAHCCQALCRKWQKPAAAAAAAAAALLGLAVLHLRMAAYS
jgi:hypothetical protein